MFKTLNASISTIFRDLVTKLLTVLFIFTLDGINKSAFLCYVDLLLSYIINAFQA